jgi:hypothetical protein
VIRHKLLRRTGAVAGAALVAFLLSFVTAVPAQADSVGTIGVESSHPVHRASIDCSRPVGEKTNYSWSNSGSVSVTVYFNNHCSHKVYATLHYTKSGEPDIIDCLNTNGGTKGKKKFPHEPLPGYSLQKITKGCPIP